MAIAGCHPGVARWRAGVSATIALAGNPNVGKSTVFNRLTGMAVETANYPGKTVDVNLATTRFRGREVGVLDLPGTYALGSTSDDQWVARRALLDGRPDVVVVVLDATRLERNLFLLLQLADLGVPAVAALNLVDEAWRGGLRLDHARLAQLLRVPVVPTVAVSGQGLDEVIAAALRVIDAGAARLSAPRYGRDVESALGALAVDLEKLDVTLPWNVPARAVATLLLENDDEARAWAAASPEARAIAAAIDRAVATIGEGHDETVAVRIARERHGLAGEIAARVVQHVTVPSGREARAWRLTTAPLTGYPLLGLVLATLFATLFFVGDLLATTIGGAWETLAAPWIRAGVGAALGDGVAAKTLLWTVDAGVNAALTVGIPYVLVFYVLLAALEDSGYLTSVAFLTDPLMHRLGLHGRAVIPLVAGAGCSVPATMGTRVLGTMRERVIATTLIALTPCSARTAVIAGAVAHYVGWQAALAVYGVVTVLAIGAGVALNRLLPGRSPGLVMEMFPFRRPCWRTTVRRTWYRFRGFVAVATPIVLAGSFVLGLAYESGVIWWLAVPMAPVVEGWLGLPAVAGLTLLFGVLRKELALQLLLTLAVARYGAVGGDLGAFMTGSQIFTYTLVNTLSVPCVATIAVMGRELGWRRAGLVAAFTIALAVTAGGLARIALA